KIFKKMATGIFFHYQRGERLKDFPEALGSLLAKKNVLFYDALYPLKPISSLELPPVPYECIKRVHTADMIERVKAAGDYEGAVYSAAGTFFAAMKIASGELTNAFVFTGFGDHHAGGSFYGGGCYFNGAAIAIRELQTKRLMKKFAIIDTDAHHGNGTWDLFKDNMDVLYLCLCNSPFKEGGVNINIEIPLRTSDKEYLRIAETAFQKWIMEFKPECIFWNWGYDGTIGEYGDLGLTPAVHKRLARLLKNIAGNVCAGRLITILCGGHGRKMASNLIPGIIEVLSDDIPV
ncbi:MAG: hypothetical protein JW882_12510, partial [Deltaproteobacteria bacterium]|nr:hypothetical protein [Deltaproteobacteria bacterium]